jgi:hypothetical protein
VTRFYERLESRQFRDGQVGFGTCDTDVLFGGMQRGFRSGNPGACLGPATRVERLRLQRVNVDKRFVFLDEVAHFQVDAAGGAGDRRGDYVAIDYAGLAFFLDGDLHGRAFRLGDIDQAWLGPESICQCSHD